MGLQGVELPHLRPGLVHQLAEAIRHLGGDVFEGMQTIARFILAPLHGCYPAPPARH